MRPPGDQRIPSGADLPSLDEMAERLARALAHSTADETELCWLESAGAEVTSEAVDATVPHRSRAVFVRAREGARRGAFRTATADLAEIVGAVRQAVAASRAAAPIPAPTLSPDAPGGEDDGGGEAAPPPLWDAEIAALGPLAAAELLRPIDAHGSLAWTLTRVAVATSEGVERRGEATCATLRLESPGRGGGRAAASARFLADLDPAAVAARSRRRRADTASEAPLLSGALLFSQEAACELVALLASSTLSSAGFAAPGSPLAGMLGEHVFAPTIDLMDDGTDPAGLPFPFDLLGRPARRLPLVERGVLQTPAIDDVLALRLRRAPTPHATAPEEARPGHLFLLPHEDETEVLAAAEGGVWAGSLERLECFDPGRVAVRARLVGARRIAGGALGDALPDLIWEDSLLRLFSRVRAVGGSPVRLATDREGLGGVSAPMIAVDGAESLRSS